MIVLEIDASEVIIDDYADLFGEFGDLAGFALRRKRDLLIFTDNFLGLGLLLLERLDLGSPAYFLCITFEFDLLDLFPILEFALLGFLPCPGICNDALSYFPSGCSGDDVFDWVSSNS